MAKKGKLKVSKLKRSNQVITKLKKQGKLKSQRHKKRKVTHTQPSKSVNNDKSTNSGSDVESLQGSDMMDMIEDDDLDYLMETNGRNMKRDQSEDEDHNIEEEYEINQPVKKSKKTKQLLPIKTKDGLVMQQLDEESDVYLSDEEDNELLETEELMPDDAEEEADDDDEAKIEGAIVDTEKPMSATDVLVARHKEIQRCKFKIGVLSSAIVENPENKIESFFGLLNFMDEKTKKGHENLHTIRKLSTVSILEVFKDIIPDYQISQRNFGETKLKKETLLLHKFESSLLAHYKRYLQRLEKMSLAFVKKKGDTRKITTSRIKLGHIAITCLCDLLVSHPYFNYSSNVVQLLVPFLNNRNPAVRATVSQGFKNIFKTDKKGAISLTIVRKINQLVKKCSNDVNCEVLNCFLALRIKDINLDDEKLMELKQKKQESHKQRLISMSKKERKRNKKLKELEKEMLETKAEENKQTKQQNLTEIVKTVFVIYFRILKRSPNSKLLSVTLEGLSKFAHVMNLEFFSDLVNLLDKLLADEDLGYREQLHCVDTVFTILSGQGEVINIDPARFYAHLYRNLLVVHAGRNHEDLTIILRTLSNILIKRRKKVSQQIILAFLKRISSLSLQVLHNGTLSLLGIIKTVMQQYRQSQSLLELDTELGSGMYDPYLMEPEYCNASGSALYEVTLLRRHYHPTVRSMACYIASGVPVSGEGILPANVAKLSPEQLYTEYDGSQMAFKPSIPVPKKTKPKSNVGRHTFTHPSFEEYCNQVAKRRLKGNHLDFAASYQCDKVKKI